ncbi:YfjI family protein [Thiothrix unzii]|uniref:DUF3987 domain-containing protein n=1 Tax=Thiothrix unzii TaxID=111769 RepID=A0A975IG91_9GAMM|nr:YfjI family protein [Thiothrix unzii]QTR52522.1 DUF3987 domain-containing protein [Thiothrix unzii]
MAVPAKILQMATIEKPAYQWDTPEPLTQQSSAAPYPLDALPGIIGAAVREVVAIVKCPAALAANSALSVLATACQGVANIKPNPRLKKPSPLSLIMVTIGDPNERKSAADDFFSEEIGEWCDNKTQELEPELKAYKAEFARWNAQKRGLEKAIESAESKCDPANLQKGEEAGKKLVMLEQNEPARVYAPRMTTKDATPEGIANHLRNKWASLCNLSAEGGAVFGGHGMAKDKAMRNFSRINELWEGGKQEVTRSSDDDSFIITGVRFSMGIAIQPDLIREFFETNGRGATGSGFFARWLLSFPDTTQGTRFEDVETLLTEAQTPSIEAFRKQLHGILEQQYTNGKGGKFDNLPTLKLSREALGIWVNYLNSVERELVSGGDFEGEGKIAGKNPNNAARLAGLFHLFNGGDVLDAISGETMRAACRLAGWHLYEARRFFGDVALPKDDLEAVKLDAWLIAECKANGEPSISKSRVLQRVTPANLRKADKLNKALDTLERANRIRQIKEGKTAVIEVNPALLKEVK